MLTPEQVYIGITATLIVGLLLATPALIAKYLKSRDRK
jgi:hypothetical protein